MTELSFLIDLLLNPILPQAMKEIIADRIKEVEQRISAGGYVPPRHAPVALGAVQAPSTLAAMARHGDIPAVVMPPIEVEPVTQIAQNQATAQALIKRNELMNAAIGNTTGVNARGGKRKF